LQLCLKKYQTRLAASRKKRPEQTNRASGQRQKILEIQLPMPAESSFEKMMLITIKDIFCSLKACQLQNQSFFHKTFPAIKLAGPPSKKSQHQRAEDR
jgi:hypothetical protein